MEIHPNGHPCSSEDPPTGSPVLSLFSGAGGLDLGFQDAGFHPLLAIDKDPAALETYRANHPRVAVEDVDLAECAPSHITALWEKRNPGCSPVGIIGGPPCQGFSSSNVHQDDDDPRRQLLFKYGEIVSEFFTKFDISFFVMENVPGLAHTKHKTLFDRFTQRCDNLGFHIVTKLLDAGTFGIAQHRKRLVVAGINKRKHPEVILELTEGDQEPLNVDQVIADLPPPTFYAKNLKPDQVPYHRNHVAMVPRSQKFKDGTLKPGHGRGLSFKVLSWDSPSFTVAYGHNEVHIHPDGRRRLSIYEAMLLQGFPPHGYHLEGNFTQQVQLVSNAVPPPLGEAIGNQIADALSLRQAN